MRGARRCRRPWSHTNVRGIDERYRSRPDGGRCVTRENEDVARNASLACTLPLRRGRETDCRRQPARDATNAVRKASLRKRCCRFSPVGRWWRSQSARRGTGFHPELRSCLFHTAVSSRRQRRKTVGRANGGECCRRLYGADDGTVQTTEWCRLVQTTEQLQTAKKKKTRRCRRRAVAFQS